MNTKSILIALLFTAASTFAQTAEKAAYPEFKKEFEAYRDNPEVASENSTLKPGPCGQYNLQYMITSRGTEELVNTPPPKKLCADMMRFDKAKNPNAPADWDYEIKPVGSKYYTITATKKGAEGKEVYYYVRKEAK